jgi:hypothetical protein
MTSWFLLLWAAATVEARRLPTVKEECAEKAVTMGKTAMRASFFIIVVVDGQGVAFS